VVPLLLLNALPVPLALRPKLRPRLRPHPVVLQRPALPVPLALRPLPLVVPRLLRVPLVPLRRPLRLLPVLRLYNL
jgi:hypothetical protein